VISRWRGGLDAWGVPPARSESLARWIIEESLRVQEEVPKSPASPSGAPQDVAIVGGAGAMGRWIGDFLEDGGHRVAVVDPRGALPGRPALPDVETAMRRSEVVVFATPIRQTGPLLKRAVAVPSEALVFDVLSVKAPIAPILREAAEHGRRVTSVHPMFGPSARTLSGRNLLVVSCGVPEADRAARSLFASSALNITEVTLEQHDRLIAESLGLSHAVNLLFLATLASDPLSPHELARAASTTFHRQSSLARALASEGPELYLDIQSFNPHTWGTFEELREALGKLQDLAERHDVPAFRALLDAGNAKLGASPEPMRA
jgi:chorismate mutase / prephenate dehydrogenase